MLLAGPGLVAEVRGAKSEIAKRFDKSDKNAAPIEFGIYKVNLELLGDGSPVMLSVFLDSSAKPDEFAQSMKLKRGDVILVQVSRLEVKNGVRRAVCARDGMTVLDKAEVEELRGQRS